VQGLLMKQYYECHITISGTHRADVQLSVEDIGWIFSEIDGDPDLGSGVKQYATKHFNVRKKRENVIAELSTAADALRSYGCIVLREKVELVIYDKRTP
jgi:hypothetical protein